MPAVTVTALICFEVKIAYYIAYMMVQMFRIKPLFEFVDNLVLSDILTITQAIDIDYID